MGEIIYPIGKASLDIKGLKNSWPNLIIVARMMSAWDVEVYVSLIEVLRLIFKAIPLVILMLVMASFHSSRKFFKRCKSMTPSA